MPPVVTLPDVTLRLTLAILAGGLIGLNRGEHGHPAGLRTTLLVCLAACVSMIQANILVASAGRPSDSFVMMDVMRLPLGILSGMGFIGGGVILKRENLVLGVTTAATLWFVTVLGLCFGGGQIALGCVAFVIGMVVLYFVKTLELKLRSVRRGTLTVTLGRDGPADGEVRKVILASAFQVVSTGAVYDQAAERRTWICELRWRALPDESDEPEFLKVLEALKGFQSLSWRPQGIRAYMEE
jgi:putative Mg2+ transporter-C (MgtC) family protein